MSRGEFKGRLERFYAVYNPSCVSSVDALLDTYQGREEDIFRVLVDKYGPEPPLVKCNGENQLQNMKITPEFPVHDRPLQFHNFHPHHSHGRVADDRLDPRGHLELETACRGAMISISDNKAAGKRSFTLDERSENDRKQSLRIKLIRFYQKNNSSMIPFVDDIIDNYNGNEEEMFKDLHRQYGIKEIVTPHACVFPSTDVDSVMKRLSAALEAKTAETLALKRDKEQLAGDLAASTRLLGELREREKLLQAQLQAVEKQLQENHVSTVLQVKDAENLALRKEKETLSVELEASKKLLDNFREEEMLLRNRLLVAEEKLKAKENTAVDAASRNGAFDTGGEHFHAETTAAKGAPPETHLSLANLKHRVRVLEVEKQQLLDELKDAEKRALDVGDLLSMEHRKVLSLLEEMGSLKLAVERPGTEAAFASIVKDIEARFSSHYEAELERYRTEMKEYYLYAENQLRRRDALIAVLGTNQ